MQILTSKIGEEPEIITYPDRHFLFAPAGMVYEVKYYPYDSITITENHPRTVTGVHIEGTMNDNSDEDQYYSFEIAIPWSELGIEPHQNVTMGLEIWNCDKEYPDGNYIYSGWNTSASNCKNTSEWGNIILVRKNMHSKKNVLMYVITGCIVFITGFIFLRRRIE